MVAGQVVLLALCEASALVSTEVSALMRLVSYCTIAENYACMTAKVIKDVYSGRLFYKTTVKFCKIDVHQWEQKKVDEFANEPVQRVVINDRRFSYLAGAHTNKKDGLPNSVDNKPASAAFNKWLDTGMPKKDIEEDVKDDWCKEVLLTDMF